MNSGIESENATSPDGVLTAVANDYRRAVLRSLNQNDRTWMPTSALVDRVAERVQTRTAVGNEHRRRVHTDLHHNHLPKLEGDGMIVYDTGTDRVKDTTGEFGEEVLALVASFEVRE